ncbi:MAG: enoyl-CoA hydratase-related protein [Stellaceae bacterium]
MPGNDTVLCAIDARDVASVTLNRPAVGNAYNGALIDGLIETFARLGREPGLRCVVLRGAGRHFQDGADLAFLSHARPSGSRQGLRLRPGPGSGCMASRCFAARGRRDRNKDDHDAAQQAR